MSTLYVDNLRPNLASQISIPAPGLYIAGHVIQVVNAEYANESITTSTSFVDTGLYATITPTNSSSKILVSVNASFFIESNTETGFELHSNITRNGAGVKEFRRNIVIRAASSGGFVGNGSHNSLVFLDAPSSTSALTYRLQIASSSTNANARINKDSVARSTITLMEIAQ